MMIDEYEFLKIFRTSDSEFVGYIQEGALTIGLYYISDGYKYTRINNNWDEDCVEFRHEYAYLKEPI